MKYNTLRKEQAMSIFNYEVNSEFLRNYNSKSKDMLGISSLTVGPRYNYRKSETRHDFAGDNINRSSYIYE